MWVSFVCSLILIPQVYYLVRLLWNEHAGVWSAALATGYVMLVLSSCEVATEPLYVVLFLWFATLVWRYVQDGAPWRLPLVALSIGLMYLSRVEGLTYVVVAAFWVAVALRRHRAVGLGRSVAALLIAAVVLAAVMLPYVTFLRGATGRWVLSGKVTNNLWGGLTVTGVAPSLVDSLEAAHGRDNPYSITDPRHGDIIMPALRAQPSIFLRLYLASLLNDGGAVLAKWWPLIVVVLAGWLASGYRAGRARAGLFLVSLVVIPLLTVPLTSLSERPLRHVTVVLVIAAGVGVELLRVRLDRLAWPWRPSIGTVAVVAALGLVLLQSARWVRIAVVYEDRQMDVRDMGAWMRENGLEGSRVMAGKQLVPYYARCVYVPAPNLPLEEMISYARRKGVRYIVADTRYLLDRYPQTQPLLQDQLPGSLHLRPIHEMIVPPGVRSRLLEVLPTSGN